MVTLIKNGTIVNEGLSYKGSLLINDNIIEKIIAEKSFDSQKDYEEALNYYKLQKLGEYIKSLIESDEFINKEECYNKLLEIKEENNYSVGISSIDYVGLSTYYAIVKDNKAPFRIMILRTEYDLDSFEIYLNKWFDEEAKKNYYSKNYLFGRIAIMPSFSEEFDYLKETDIYKYVTENGINAYEYYLNNKND